VRAYWDGAELWSRTGLRLPRCDDIRAALPRGIAFDGEVVRGTYWVFDLPNCAGIYTERRSALVCTLALVRGARVRLTPHVTWEDVERLGLEGVVFKRKKSRYPPLAHRPGVQTPAWVKFRTTTATTTTTGA